MTKKIFKSEEEKMRLRFASYNIFHGGLAKYDMSKIAKNIVENDIDVVGIQEVDIGTLRSGKINVIAELAKASGYPYYAFFKTIDFDGGDYGIAVLSRYPIVESEKLELESGKSEKRALGMTKIDVDGNNISFFVTHLTYRDKDVRVAQLSYLADLLSKTDDFILTGDFNTCDLGDVDKLENLGRVNCKESPTVTFPEDSLSIDNILYSKSHWRFENINIVTDSYSDHYMIWADGETVWTSRRQ